MGKKIFVGNLSFSTTDADLETLFSAIGPCESAKVITDRDTGRSRGFGFVDMPQSEAQSAIQALNGFQMNGRPLRVNEAQERPQRPRQGFSPWIFVSRCASPRSTS